MSGLAALLALAAVAFGLAKALHLSPIPLLLLAGLATGAIAEVFGIAVPDQFLREVIEIGLAVLVFSAGVELSPRRMRGRARPILIVASLQFLILGLAGIATALWLDYDLMTALYLGCALSASSTMVVVRQLQQRRQMFEPYGRLVLGVLLLQDVFIITLMVVLIKAPLGWLAVLGGLAAMTGLGALAAVLHRWLVPLLCQRVKLDDEELLLGALGLLFAFSSLAYLSGLSFLVGAFFAGFTLSAFPMNGLVRGMLGSLSGFFLALFFICIGAVMTIPMPTMLGHGLVLTLVLIVVTVLLVTVVAEQVGYSTRASVECALLLSQTSEFSLVIALAGLAHGQISHELFSLVALVTVGTMTMTPYLARDKVAWALMKLHPRNRRQLPAIAALQDHAVLLGFGRGGARMLQVLQSAGIPVVVVDDDAAVIRKLTERKVMCLQGDGSDPRILQQVRAQDARLALCAMRRGRDAETALNWLRGKRPLVMVRTFEPAEAQRVRELGGLPVPTAEAAADKFLNWLAANPP